MERFLKHSRQRERVAVWDMVRVAVAVFCLVLRCNNAGGQGVEIWYGRVAETHDKYKTVREGKTANGRPNNRHPEIQKTNQMAGVPLYSPYCGSYAWRLLTEAGIQLPIAKSEAPRAYNWVKHGQHVWQKGIGWNPKYKNKVRPLDIVIFEFKTNYHVGVVIETNGTLSLLTAEGNTSEWRAVGVTIDLIREPDGSFRMKIIKPTNLKNEGIYTKFRTDVATMYAVRRYVD